MGSCGHSLHHAAGMQDGYYLSYYVNYVHWQLVPVLSTGMPPCSLADISRGLPPAQL
jgi:hypothetical protein